MAKKKKSDNSLAILISILVVFGLVVLSSAGVVEGQDKFGSSQYFLVKQILSGLLPGLLLFLILSRIKYSIWKKFAVPVLLLGIGLLVLVFMPSIGAKFKGAQRWILVSGLSFQPAEFLKLAVIIYFAAWFSKKNIKNKDWTYSAAPFLTILFFILFLLMMQPDTGTLIVILLIAFVMYFASGFPMKYIFAGALIFAIILAAMVAIEPYRLDRIRAFVDPTYDLQGSSYHIRQAMLGIGRGGIFGVGFGNSEQKINFLPEPVGDSIFVIVAEELGLVGAGFLISLFILLSVKLIQISKRAPNDFAHLFVIGVVAWVVGQAFINIGAISGVFPLTGIPLPFISYGGTALTSLLAAMGIVNNIAKHA